MYRCGGERHRYTVVHVWGADGGFDQATGDHDRVSVSQAAQNPLIGLVVFSSDGSKIGTIESVDGETDGRISAINVLTGSLLGLGTRVVAIPEGKFMRNGDSVQVSMTAEEVAKLPSVKDKV